MSNLSGGWRDTESIDGLAADLARRQHGVFGRQQALALGVTARQIDGRVRARRWEYVLPRVLRICGGNYTARLGAMASALWAGSDCFVSHGAAAVLWGYDGVRSPKVELWVPRPRNPRSSLVVVHRGPPLEDLDRAELENIPITTPTRTLIDVAGRLEDEALLTLLEGCVRRGLVTIPDLAERLDALRGSGRPGVGRLMTLVAARPADAAAIESRLEAKFWQLIAASGLPLPQRQFWVTTRVGARYRLDFAWPEQRVAVECDGRAFHDGVTFESDELRRAELASVGWLVVPVTWTQCARFGEAVLDRVRGALRLAA